MNWFKNKILALTYLFTPKLFIKIIEWENRRDIKKYGNAYSAEELSKEPRIKETLQKFYDNKSSNVIIQCMFPQPPINSTQYYFSHCPKCGCFSQYNPSSLRFEEVAFEVAE